MKSVLIFGIGGFVGKYLAHEFIINNYCVYGSDICDNACIDEANHFYKANLLNADEVSDVVKEVSPDMIINLAAVSSVGASWKSPQNTMAVNVIGALNIMEAAKKCKPMPKLMFIGSSEEYELSPCPISENTSLNANNPYGISKMTQEKFAQLYRDRYGMKIFCVRPFNHTGIGQTSSFVLPSFCKQAADIEKSGKPGIIKVGNLEAQRDFSNVRDIVRAYRLIIESDNCNKIYNVGSGKAYSLKAILDYIISLSSQPIKVEIDTDLFRPVDTPVICCDYSLIKSELGWEPKYDIFETVKEMFEFYVRLN